MTGPVVVTVGGVGSNSLVFWVMHVGCSGLPGIVYQQNWSKGIAPNAMKSNGDYYQSTQWPGGTDPVDPVYPEIASSETVTVATGAGPNGENVLDVNPAQPDYVLSGLVVGGFGSIVDPAGGPSWWDATQGCVSVSYKWTTAAWNQATYNPLLAIGRSLYTSDLGFELDANILDSGNGDFVLGYQTGTDPSVAFGDWNTIEAYHFTRTATENQWQNFEVRWKAGTINGATVAPDGWLRVYWNGTLIYNVTEVALLPSTQFNAPGGLANQLRTIWLGYYGIFGPSTNLLLTNTATGPELTSIAPASGRVASAVTLNGTGFGSAQGSGSVTFNGVAAQPITWSDTQITTTVPSGATSGPVVVTANNGIVSNPLTFTVTTPTDPGGTLTYYHTDAIGSVRMITDPNGNVVPPRYDYLPFGQDWTTVSSGDPNKLFFAGKERDRETGATGAGWSPLDYFGARYYQSQFGRFARPDDTHFMDLSIPQSMNLYAYTTNNPSRYIDPNGHEQAPLVPLAGDDAWQDLMAWQLRDMFNHAFEISPVTDGPSAKNGGRNCTIPPATASQYAAATAQVATMTAEFFSGLGPRNMTFGPDSATSRVMAQSGPVHDVLNSYYMTGRTSGLYTFGLPGLESAGANPVAQFAGSFRWSITQLDGGINLSLTNTTSFRSLTYDAGPQWQRGSLPTPMGNIHQTYNITATCH